jgi:hypothetical protein
MRTLSEIRGAQTTRESIALQGGERPKDGKSERIETRGEIQYEDGGVAKVRGQYLESAHRLRRLESTHTPTEEFVRAASPRRLISKKLGLRLSSSLWISTNSRFSREVTAGSSAAR